MEISDPAKKFAYAICFLWISGFTVAQEPQFPKVIEVSELELTKMLDCRSELEQYPSQLLHWFRLSGSISNLNADKPAVVIKTPSGRRLKLASRSLKVSYSHKHAETIIRWLKCLPELSEIQAEEGLGSNLDVFRPNAFQLFEAVAELPILERFYCGKLHTKYIEALCHSSVLSFLSIGYISKANHVSLKQLRQLKYLRVSDCDRDIWELVAALPKLDQVVMDSEQFGSPISTENSRHILIAGKHLKHVCILSTVHPSLVKAIGQIDSLESLEIEFISPLLSLSDISFISSLPNIKILHLGGRGPGPDNVAEYEEIEHLYDSVQKKIQDITAKNIVALQQAKFEAANRQTEAEQPVLNGAAK